MSFNELGLIQPIIHALNKAGHVYPTAIQQQAIPLILQGNDLLACAQTGTGKTAAFLLPILQMLDETQNRPGSENRATALILVPTRELATQVGDSINLYRGKLKLSYTVIFGGVPQRNQVRELEKKPNIIVATPGRLIDLLNQGHVNLSYIQFLVLDEADRMLDNGFIHDIYEIVGKIRGKRQTLLLSATINAGIGRIIKDFLHQHKSIEVQPASSTVEKINQKVYYVEKANKTELLVELLEKEKIQHVLVFTEMKHSADRLHKRLRQYGIESLAIHGGKSQEQRQRALRDFKNKKIRVLVATDIAARGIDIAKLGHVINYEMPRTAETYVHRIGRTARAGESGTAISFCDFAEKSVFSEIQRVTRQEVDVVPGHRFDTTGLDTPPPRLNSQPVNNRRVFGRRQRSFLQRG